MLNKQMKEHQDNAPMDKNDNLLTPLFKDVVCSYLKGGVSDRKISKVTFKELFEIISADDNVRLNTEKFRNYVEKGMTEKALECKLNQSSITASAILEGGIATENIVEYTNIALADYDHLSAGEVERCRELLRTDPHCLLFYKSMGGHGHGFHILAPVMGVHDVKTYKIAWLQMNEYYDRLLGLKHDTNCSDPVRKCILAHDPDAFINPEVAPMYIDYTALERNRRPGRPLKDVHHTLEEVGKYIDEYMKARNLKYEEGNRNNYIFNAACQLNRYGVDMEEVIGFFNEKVCDLSESEIRRAVESAYRRYEDQHGTQSPYKERETTGDKKANKGIDIQNVEDYLMTIAEFRHNLITQRYEIRWKSETEWREIDDAIINDLWRKVSKNIRNLHDKIIKNIVESSFSQPYNLFVQSFKALKPWDGVTDHIGMIADMVHIKPEYENYYSFKEAFKKWLVATVASICQTDAYNKKTLFFVGPQNTFKTTFALKLPLPAWGNQGVYTKNIFREFSRDERLMMTKVPIFLMDEVSHLGPKFLDEFKSISSQASINERAVYARHSELRPRISSFIATGNHINFLSDSTGNNRFLVFEVESIDCPYNIPTELLEGAWSQAYHLFCNGFQYWFTREEDDLIEKQNEYYTLPSTEEELLQTYYQKPEPGEQYKVVNATDIIVHLSQVYKAQLSKQEILQALRKLGFTYKKTKKKRGYMVKEIPFKDIELQQQSSDWSHLPPQEESPQTDMQATLF